MAGVAAAWEDLGRALAAITRLVAARLDAAEAALTDAVTRLARDRVDRLLDDHAERAAARRAVLEAYDPRRQLARGWTLTRTADGRLVGDVADLAAGDVLVTTFATGTAASTVTEVTHG